MKAVIFQEVGKIAFEEVNDPICEQNEVIIKITRSGICGTRNVSTIQEQSLQTLIGVRPWIQVVCTVIQAFRTGPLP